MSPVFAPACRYSEVVILSKYLLDEIAPKFLCWKNAFQIRCLPDFFAGKAVFGVKGVWRKRYVV